MLSEGLRRSQMSNVMWPFLVTYDKIFVIFSGSSSILAMIETVLSKVTILCILLRIKDIDMSQAMSVKSVEREIEIRMRNRG